MRIPNKHSMGRSFVAEEYHVHSLFYRVFHFYKNMVLSIDGNLVSNSSLENKFQEKKFDWLFLGISIQIENRNQGK